MAYIYQIQNDINNKLYIGKTEYSIEKRFAQHCRDYIKRQNEQRPLYSAMRKYGISHFHITLIEETDKPEERERYWIETLDTYHSGYNATRGGDGRPYADYDLIFQLYHKGYSINQIEQLTQYDHTTISRALKFHKITAEERRKHGIQILYRRVCKIDPNTNQILAIYNSVTEAERENQIQHHIGAVCAGKRKTAGGYKWQYI